MIDVPRPGRSKSGLHMGWGRCSTQKTAGAVDWQETLAADTGQSDLITKLMTVLTVESYERELQAFDFLPYGKGIEYEASGEGTRILEYTILLYSTTRTSHFAYIPSALLVSKSQFGLHLGKVGVGVLQDLIHEPFGLGLFLVLLVFIILIPLHPGQLLQSSMSLPCIFWSLLQYVNITSMIDSLASRHLFRLFPARCR